MSKTIPTRDQIAEKYKWRLEDIFPSTEAWSEAYAAAEQELQAVAAMNGRVAEDPKAAILACQKLNDRLSPIGAYAMLSREADNADPAAQALFGRVMMLVTRASAVLSFLEPELLEMDEAALQALLADPELADYDVRLRQLIRSKPHTLPKEQNRILAMMGDLAGAPSRTFQTLTTVNMKFPDVEMPDGTKEPLTEGTYNRYLRAPQREVRRQAFEGIMNTYGSFGETIAATYGASVQKDQTFAEATNFATALEARLFEDELPVAVYDNLTQTVHEALPVLKDYLTLRRERMGLEELHLYDLYADIVADYQMALPFEEAFALVKECLAPLGKDYTDKLQEAFDNRWMDVYPTQNKSSGAFSMGSLRDVHPYVLLNHNDDLNSAMTMAHELGHSMHSYYSNTSQPATKADYSLFVAEVASICNEALMMRALLGRLTDPKAKAYLLNYFLEMFRTTCFRQTMFAEFERETHEMILRGEPLTRESMSGKYYALNELYYGGACCVDECIANEWMRIPHFYSAFYVFVYATGFCAAIALSERILTEGESAVADYKKFLSAGCSVPPIEALKLAGIDMSRPEPIRSAMHVMQEVLSQFRDALKEAENA